MLALPGNADVRSVNAVVGETNDGFLNDIRALAVRPEHVLQAVRCAVGGPVTEGAVGAGTGTVCFGYKGGSAPPAASCRTTWADGPWACWCKPISAEFSR